MATRRFYRFITIAVLGFLIVSCTSKAGSEPVRMPVNEALLGETLAKCEELFRGRRDPANLREAVKLLGAVRNPDARNFEVEWKFAKYNYFFGRQTADEKEKEKAFTDGAQAGKIASRVAPEKPDGHFWYAANLGEQAKLSPVTVGIKSIDEIRAAMNRVIEIEPEYQSASAYDALAQIELSTAGLMGGKPEKAVEYLEKALTINKNNHYVYLHLGEAYYVTGKKVEAKRQLEYLLKMTPNPDYYPEYHETAERAKKLLATKF